MSDQEIEYDEESKNVASFATCTSSTPHRVQEQRKAQVYSSYIQPDLKRMPKKQVKSPHSDKPDEKRSKLDATLTSSLNKSEEKNDLMLESFMSSFIGIETFSCPNIFIDQTLPDVAIIVLSKESGRENFCFKGKCLFSLLSGNVEINGYKVNSELDSIEFKARWLDLNSPETNGFLSVVNRRKSVIGSLQEDHAIKTLTNRLSLSLGAEIGNELMPKLNEFFNQFSIYSSSVFVVTLQNASVCNYLTYFENFKHVYNTVMRDVSEIDSRMAKMRIFPVREQYFNSVHVTSNEERNVVEQILTGLFNLKVIHFISYF